MSGQKATRVIVTLTVILTATVTLIRGLHTGDEFIDNLFVDSYFGDGFLAEIINNDYIFPDEPMRSKRSIQSDDYFPRSRRDFIGAVIRRPEFTSRDDLNSSNSFWQPVPPAYSSRPSPVYHNKPVNRPVKSRPAFQTGNQTYNLVYADPDALKPEHLTKGSTHKAPFKKQHLHNAPPRRNLRLKPLKYGPKPNQTQKYGPKPTKPAQKPAKSSRKPSLDAKSTTTTPQSPVRRSDIHPVYKPQPYRHDDPQHKHHGGGIGPIYHEGKGPIYPDNEQNITTYAKKKLPRFLLPFPFGVYTENPLRPFPSRTFFILIPSLIVPLIPFGVWELRLPVAWNLNYLVERFNGYHEEDFTFGRNDGGRSLPDGGRSFANQQMEFYNWAGDLLSNTLGMDGKACIQRLICELAEAPVDQRSLLGEILHRIVEPRKEEFQESNDYLDAETQGRSHGDCFAKYGKCPLTIRRLLPSNYVEVMKRKRRSI